MYITIKYKFIELNEIDNLKELVTVSMAKAAEPFVYLDVPLTIDIKVGNNWNEAH